MASLLLSFYAEYQVKRLVHVTLHTLIHFLYMTAMPMNVTNASKGFQNAELNPR